jgi:hypothetical protein
MSLVDGIISQVTGAPLTPQNLLNSGLSLLNGTGSSAALSTPGTVSQLSNNGGIVPGDSLAGANARPDPLLSFTWYAQLPVISPGSTQTASGSSATSILQNLATAAISPLQSAMGGSIAQSSSAQLPWYYVEEANCPFRRYETKSIFREGRDRHYPSKYAVDDLRLSIYMDSQNNAFQYLQAWNNAMITPFAATASATMGGGWGRPIDYKLPIYIYMLDVQNNVLAIIEYVECFPTVIDSYALDSGSSNRIVSHVNFSVGDVFVNLMGVSIAFVQSIINNPTNNAITQSILGTLAPASSLTAQNLINIPAGLPASAGFSL